MNMQFGFGGYDPYMMMGYGVSPQMSGFGGLGGMGYGMGGLGGMGYGMGGFGGMGYGMGGFGDMGGMFPNYYPMFSPQALSGLGQQFYNNQFMPTEQSPIQQEHQAFLDKYGLTVADQPSRRDSYGMAILSAPIYYDKEGNEVSGEDIARMQQEYYTPAQKPQQAPVEQTPVQEPATQPETEIVSADQVGQTGAGQLPKQTPAPTYGLKNPMEFQGAGKFNSVEDRTKAANQILANTKGGGYGKVRKLVRSGNVKAAQEQLGKVQQRQIRKKGK